MITIRVLFFGAARDIVDQNPLSLSFEETATVSQAYQQLTGKFSGLERSGRSLLFAVNQEYATLNTNLTDEDELAIFPPVSGGSHDFFELTTEPIDVGSVARRVVLPECGAIVSLDGFTREWTKGRQTKYLVYEAYDGMAVSEMQRLGAEAHKRFDIAHIGIVPHRTPRNRRNKRRNLRQRPSPQSRLRSLRMGHPQTQTHVPIWKKEVYEDGEEWVEPQKGT